MADDFFTLRYGDPDPWKCPDCGVLFLIYPALPFEHLCTSQIRYSPKRVYYWCAMDAVTGHVRLCLTAEGDPKQTVSSLMPTGERVPWEKHVEGDLIVFEGPKDYDPRSSIDWQYDKRLQFRVHLPEHLVAKYALRGRVSA